MMIQLSSPKVIVVNPSQLQLVFPCRLRPPFLSWNFFLTTCQIERERNNKWHVCSQSNVLHIVLFTEITSRFLTPAAAPVIKEEKNNTVLNKSSSSHHFKQNPAHPALFTRSRKQMHLLWLITNSRRTSNTCEKLLPRLIELGLFHFLTSIHS